MNFSPTEEQQVLREQIVRFARRELSPERTAVRDAAGFPRQAWLACGEMGLQGLPVPVEQGGVGLDGLGTAVALEALGYGCRDGGLVFAVCAHLLASVVPVWRHGSDELKERYLADLCSGRLVAVNGMTETESGSDAFAMQTRAVAADGGWVISGRKTFGSNAPVADLAVVYAMTDPDKGAMGGVTAFVVERGEHGFSTGQTYAKMGLASCPLGEIVLDEVRVPDSAVLGKPGGGATVFSESMSWERACLVASHVGTMDWLIERAVEHARSRRQFGQKIGGFQAVSHRIADMKARVEAGRLLAYRAASRLASRDGAMHAAIAKLFVSEALLESALAAVRVFGGYGYTAEFGVEEVLRDSVGGVLYSGTSDMQREIIARWLGLPR